ncbi:hypothetical protein [Kribbella catacumbae]|uniref:hypothetical protein n=1 Tax=Kribbella catacumbae TaxID=460086 RepID=UPI0003635C7B|nr:hypothetical protein [Kribbella catacumbae]
MAAAKSTRSGGEEWTDEDVHELRDLAAGNTPLGVISVRLERSEGAIRSKAQAEGISLAPANQPQSGDLG